jgi:hypothetical protein
VSDRSRLLLIMVAVAIAIWLLLVYSSSAQFECFPDARRIEQALTNLEVVRVESVRQTELLKDIRELLKRGKP